MGSEWGMTHSSLLSRSKRTEIENSLYANRKSGVPRACQTSSARFQNLLPSGAGRRIDIPTDDVFMNTTIHDLSALKSPFKGAKRDIYHWATCSHMAK